MKLAEPGRESRRSKAEGGSRSGDAERVGRVVPAGGREADRDGAGKFVEPVHLDRRPARVRRDDAAEDRRGGTCGRREAFADAAHVAATLRRAIHDGIGDDRERRHRGVGRRTASDARVADIGDEGRARRASAPRASASNASMTAASSAKTSGWSHSDARQDGDGRPVGVEVAGVLVRLDDEGLPLSRGAPSPAARRCSALGSSAPTNADGSAPAATSTWTSQPAVVLLPCVPATPTSVRPTAASATTCCHGSTGIPAARAAASSG